MFDAICAAEDSLFWVALLCGNHLGHFVAFWPFA
jgi:hypothetical protein